MAKGTTVECETMEVTLQAKGESRVRLTIPAYTRSAVNLGVEVEKHFKNYLEGSRLYETAVSIGDFALYLLKVASLEPRYMEGPHDESEETS